MFRCRCWLALLAVLALPRDGRAQDVDATDASILVRALAYDRAIDRNGSGDLVVAVLYDPGSKSSKRATPNVLRAFKSAGVQGLGRRDTLAGSASYARRGVSIGLDGPGGRPQLYVNLAGSRAAGADLTSPLLKLATVYQ